MRTHSMGVTLVAGLVLLCMGDKGKNGTARAETLPEPTARDLPRVRRGSALN